ncbi:MAG: lipopolysaccharide biosynthesis protein [Candidatus Lernaella stagnicola]|nr:lipopolysaccharide biosynthesis protein [Candidatus Lernaella stagnicola]
MQPENPEQTPAPRGLQGLIAGWLRGSVVRDFLRVMFGHFAGRAGLALSMILIARWLPEAEYGKFIIGYGFMMFFANVWSGFYQGLIRQLSELTGAGEQGRAEGLFWAAFRFQTLVLTALLVGVLVFAQYVALGLYGNPELATAVRFGALAGFLAAWTQLFAIHYQTSLRFNRYALILNLRYAVITVGVVAAGVSPWFNLYVALGLIVVAGLAPAAIAMFDVRRLGRGIERVGLGGRITQIVTEQVLVIIYFLLIWLGLEIPMMLVSHIEGDLETVGTFGIAWRIFQISFMVLSAVYHVLIPRLSRDREFAYQRHVFKRWLTWTPVPAALFALVFWVTMPLVIPWLFAGKYDAAIPLVQIFGVLIGYNFVLNPLFMLLAQKDFGWLVGCGVWFFLANAVGGYFLISAFGFIGAGFSVAIAYQSNLIGVVRSWRNIQRRTAA